MAFQRVLDEELAIGGRRKCSHLCFWGSTGTLSTLLWQEYPDLVVLTFSPEPRADVRQSRVLSRRVAIPSPDKRPL